MSLYDFGPAEKIPCLELVGLLSVYGFNVLVDLMLCFSSQLPLEARAAIIVGIFILLNGIVLLNFD